MKRKTAFVSLCAIALLFVIGCDGGPTEPSDIGCTVSPDPQVVGGVVEFRGYGLRANDDGYSWKVVYPEGEGDPPASTGSVRVFKTRFDKPGLKTVEVYNWSKQGSTSGTCQANIVPGG